MTQKTTEMIVHQALLPGVEHILALVLRALNDTREALAMPPLTLQGRSEGEPVFSLDLQHVPSNGGDAPNNGKKRQMSMQAKRKVGASVHERWNIVKSAGIDTGGRIPTNADVERARQILAKRKAPVADGAKKKVAS
jgi:hypothetical protein